MRPQFAAFSPLIKVSQLMTTTSVHIELEFGTAFIRKQRADIQPALEDQALGEYA